MESKRYRLLGFLILIVSFFVIVGGSYLYDFLETDTKFFANGVRKGATILFLGIAFVITVVLGGGYMITGRNTRD